MQQAVSLATQYVNNGDLDNAINIYKEILQQVPHHALSLKNLCYLYSKKKDFSRAFDYAKACYKVLPDDLNNFFNMSFIKSELGEHEEALKIINELLEKEPESVRNWVQKGVCLQHLKKVDEAISAFRHVLIYEPRNITALRNLTFMSISKDMFGDAFNYANILLGINSSDPLALYAIMRHYQHEGDAKRGLIYADKLYYFEPSELYLLDGMHVFYMSAKQYEKALRCCEKIMQQDSNNEKIVEDAGVCAENEGRYQLAAEYLEKVVKNKRHNVSLLSRLGSVYEKLKQYGQAVYYAKLALEIDPDNSHVYAVLALSHLGLKKYNEALRYIDEGLSTHPKNAFLWSAMGLVFIRLGEYKKAIKYLKKSIKFDPANEAPYISIGLCYGRLNKYKKCMQWYEKAADINPHHRQLLMNQAVEKMRHDDLYEGLKLYEYRSSNTHESLLLNEKHFPEEKRWVGDQDLNGKVIHVIAEQGRGDIFIFARYIPMLAERGAKVIVYTIKALKPIMQTIEGVYLCAEEGDNVAKPDYYVPIASLPYCFKTNNNSIPANVPYFSVDSNVSEKFKNIMNELNDTNLKVGLCWAGNSEYIFDRERSINLEELKPLLSIPNVSFYNLQYGERTVDMLRYHLKDKFIDLMAYVDDYMDTAALMSQLDLIISVDTGIVHLAGGLNLPVWVMLPLVCDWRWFVKRDDSPWYPRTRLFRQKKLQNWKTVIKELSHELLALSKKVEG